MSAPPAVRRAESPADFRMLTEMLREYAEELGVDLCFQNFAAELADPAGVYEAALLAGADDAPAGCVALKRLDARRCEMKRLYVRPAFRGTGLGRRLAEAIIAEARAKGFAEMVLDTLERLKPAVAMYESMGFARAQAYYDNPEPDVVYMRLAL
ncbi:Acetyltransferase (GNAT) family protein [Amphiplicatus metriothermophilus]|uniref:Acetyltransferase (GNAT) family protein n=2 Tax=Amphiplicatus metriothermophilus TaxID=1519374 RepID=A0A239PVF2_9PROT|nr:Acetyltransferase (GNAT) family protein [Amphiplicatus metriothermophilus]